MTISLFQEYAELKLEEKRIELRINELKGQVIEEMQAEGVDKQPTPLGNFTLSLTKKWKYSGAVKEADEFMKNLKEKEKQDGTAECTEVAELKFFTIKPSLEE